MVIEGMLGLAFRAGQLVPGADMAHKLVREGKAALVILDHQAGPNTRKKLQDACNHYHVQVMLLDAGILGGACGRPGMAAAALKQGEFARQIKAKATATPHVIEEINQERLLEDKG